MVSPKKDHKKAARFSWVVSFSPRNGTNVNSLKLESFGAVAASQDPGLKAALCRVAVEKFEETFAQQVLRMPMSQCFSLRKAALFEV